MIREPFKFLDAYTRDDQDIFFGRDQEVEEIHSRLLSGNLLLIYGASGSGKTSLLQCGVAGRFHDADWKPVFIRRKENILDSLNRELEKIAVTRLKPGASIPNKLNSIYLDYLIPVYLIFDQFEEVFIFGDQDEKKAFIAVLSEILKLDKSIRIVISIREEYLAHLSEFEDDLPLLFANRIRIEKMSRVNAAAAIQSPCEACGVAIEASLCETIVERLSRETGFIELTYLQVLMDKLYKKAVARDQEHPEITLEDFSFTGDIGNVLSDFLTEQLAGMENADQAEAVLKAMISIEGTKKQVNIEDISSTLDTIGKPMEKEGLIAILQEFVKVRIIHDQDDRGYYELRHDSLARRIFEQMTAIEKDILQIKEMLDNRYLDYERRGALLDAETLKYLAPYESKLHLSAAIAGFVEKSKSTLAATATRRRKFIKRAAATVFAAVLLFTFWNMFERIKGEHLLASIYARDMKRSMEVNDHGFVMLYAKKFLDIEDTWLAKTVRFVYQVSEGKGKSLLNLPDNGDIEYIGTQAKAFFVPEIVSFKGHTGGVKSVAYSPDGKTLASGSRDGTIHLRNTATGEEITVLKGHTDDVSSVAYRPDGKTIASGSGDGTIRLWDTATNKLITVLGEHTDDVTSVAYSPDGKSLVSGSRDKTIRLWNTTTNKLITALKGHTDDVTSVAYSPDGKTLVSGSRDKTIRLWDIAAGKEVTVLKGHTSWVNSIAYSPDGKTLASGSCDETVRLWNTASYKGITVLKGHTSWVNSIAYSPDGSKTLASGSEDNTIRLWDTATCKEITVLKGVTKRIFSVAYSPDGKIVAYGSTNKTIRLWDTASGKIITDLKGHTDDVTSVAYSPDGKIIASGSNDKTIRLWDTATNKEITVLQGHKDIVSSVAYSPDGKFLISGSRDKTIRLWDIAAGKEVTVLHEHKEGVYSVAYSPDGKSFASGSGDRMGMWDSATGKEITNLQGQGETGAYSGMGMWDSATGKEITNLQGQGETGAYSVVYNPSGKTLAAVSLGRVHLWDIATGKEISVLKGHTMNVTAIAFSPDGKTIALAKVYSDVGFYDKTVLILDAVTGKEIIGLKMPSSSVFCVVYSPDGKTIAAAAEGDKDSVIFILRIDNEGNYDYINYGMSYDIDYAGNLVPKDEIELAKTRLNAAKEGKISWLADGGKGRVELYTNTLRRERLEPDISKIEDFCTPKDSEIMFKKMFSAGIWVGIFIILLLFSSICLLIYLTIRLFRRLKRIFVYKFLFCFTFILIVSVAGTIINFIIKYGILFLIISGVEIIKPALGWWYGYFFTSIILTILATYYLYIFFLYIGQRPIKSRLAISKYRKGI